MKVRIQVIRVNEVEFPDECADPIAAAYAMRTTEIAETGELIDVTTENAEIMDESEVEFD